MIWLGILFDIFRRAMISIKKESLVNFLDRPIGSKINTQINQQNDMLLGMRGRSKHVGSWMNKRKTHRKYDM